LLKYSLRYCYKNAIAIPNVRCNVLELWVFSFYLEKCEEHLLLNVQTSAAQSFVETVVIHNPFFRIKPNLIEAPSLPNFVFLLAVICLWLC